MTIQPNSTTKKTTITKLSESVPSPEAITAFVQDTYIDILRKLEFVREYCLSGGDMDGAAIAATEAMQGIAELALFGEQSAAIIGGLTHAVRELASQRDLALDQLEANPFKPIDLVNRILDHGFDSASEILHAELDDYLNVAADIASEFDGSDFSTDDEEN